VGAEGWPEECFIKEGQDPCQPPPGAGRDRLN
jgi:hypothetical protein